MARSTAGHDVVDIREPVVGTDDPRVTVLEHDLAIVHDDIEIITDSPTWPEVLVLDDELLVAPHRPVLVDLTGRRARVMRTVGLCSTLTIAGLLASLPIAMAVPERTRATDEVAASTALRGSVFVDADCDGLRSTGDTAATATVELVRGGTVIATTTSRADGSFAFARVTADGLEVVRVSPTVANSSAITDPSLALASDTVPVAIGTAACIVASTNA